MLNQLRYLSELHLFSKDIIKMRTFIAFSALAVASAQVPKGFTQYTAKGCEWAQFVEDTDWSKTTAVTVADCSRACVDAIDDGCTGFEFGSPSSGDYCTLWYNGACALESDMQEFTGYAITTFTAAKFAEVPQIVEDEITTTVAAKVETEAAVQSDTTVEAVTLSDSVYTLKYPQQACVWSDYVEDADWTMYDTESSDPVACAAACLVHEGCTGFEVGSDSGSSYGHSEYCAFWLNDACSTPDHYYNDAFSFSTGELIEVDTYTLAEPLDAFVEYENNACAWSYYVEGEDWEFASKDSDDAAACAKLCLESEDGCTGFEVGSSTSTSFGDLTKGYCAFWFNNTCQPNDMLHYTVEASTYILIGSSGCGYGSSHIFYAMVIAFAVMMCLAVCCCCRRAMMRRRLARQRAAARAVAAVAGTNSRAVVYAVRVEDVQEETGKV